MFKKISSHALSMTAILALSACAMQQNPAPVSDATQSAALPNITYDANANVANQVAVDDTGSSSGSPYVQSAPTTTTASTANPYGETPYAPNTSVVNTTAPTFSAGTQAAIQELVGNVNGVYYGNYSPVDKTASIHIVQRGDTVYNISKRYGISQDTLRSLNNLSADNTISLGQSLRVKATGNSIGNLNNTATPASQAKPVVSKPEATQSVPPKTVSQATPAVVPTVTTQPEVVATPSKSEPSNTSFVTQNKSGITWQAPTAGKIHYPFGGDNKGVDISGARGQDIYAAADGEVVYSGTGLRGYGKLIIIKHNETYLTAYGNNDSLLVSEGQTVKRGQQIAKMGSSDSNNGVKLHFELRENGTPVNPNNYIKFN